MLILSEQDLRNLLPMRDVIAAVEAGFRALAAGLCAAPERLRVDAPETGGLMFTMPAYIAPFPTPLSGNAEQQGALGTKIAAVFPRNAERGKDVVQALYVLSDSETGVPLAVMEGRFITGIRTAATSAVATSLMTPPGARRLAIFGAGVQALHHIDAMAETVEIERVAVVSRTRERAAALVGLIGSRLAVPCFVATAEEAVTNSDLICTCTTAPTPLFPGASIAPGTHINAVGAFTPATRELDTEAVRRARVIIDAESAAGREAGELILPIAEGAFDSSHVKGTLADLVSGRVRGRTSADEITLFKSCGLAVEDLVTARLAYRRALEHSLGVEVAL